MRSHLILVEGQDELWFFDAVLASLGADPSKIQTIDYGGSGELPRYLENLFKSDPVMDGSVSSVLVTGDADTYVGALPYKVNKVLKSYALPEFEDRKVHRLGADSLVATLGFCLLPEHGSEGSLETLLLGTVDGDNAAAAARQMVEAFHGDRAPKNDKRVAQAYLATRQRLSRGAGWGAREGYFDIRHDALVALKKVIAEFLA